MPPAAPTLLASLADTFELLVDEDIPSVAVGVVPRDHDTDLVVRTLRRHPADELLGFTAPATWEAVAIVAQGRTQPCPRGADDPPSTLAPPPGATVRVAHLLDRTGAALTRLTDAAGRRHDLSSAEGLVPDLCRRVLGLPTAPPAEPPLRYWAACWLMAVVEGAAGAGAGPAWAAVAACHPAVTTVAAIDPALVAVAGDHLVAAATSLSEAQPWEELHRRWSDPGGGGHADLRPEEVAWMDVGMLARWCLASVPEVEDLYDAVQALLSPHVAQQVGDALASWGLVDRPAQPAGRTDDPAPGDAETAGGHR